METPKTFKELFANTGIEPTTDESGNTNYNFKATLKEEPNIIDYWLEKNGNQEIAKQVEIEAEELSKQEILEEIVNKLSIKEAKDLDLFLKGIEWQQEQDKKLYSEEDMINFAQWFSDYEIPKSELISFTEQFKKK
jgi:hypothetical protein